MTTGRVARAVRQWWRYTLTMAVLCACMVPVAILSVNKPGVVLVVLLLAGVLLVSVPEALRHHRAVVRIDDGDLVVGRRPVARRVPGALVAELSVHTLGTSRFVEVRGPNDELHVDLRVPWSAARRWREAARELNVTCWSEKLLPAVKVDEPRAVRVHVAAEVDTDPGARLDVYLVVVFRGEHRTHQAGLVTIDPAEGTRRVDVTLTSPGEVRLAMAGLRSDGEMLRVRDGEVRLV